MSHTSTGRVLAWGLRTWTVSKGSWRGHAMLRLVSDYSILHIDKTPSQDSGSQSGIRRVLSWDSITIMWLRIMHSRLRHVPPSFCITPLERPERSFCLYTISFNSVLANLLQQSRPRLQQKPNKLRVFHQHLNRHTAFLLEQSIACTSLQHRRTHRPTSRSRS